MKWHHAKRQAQKRRDIIGGFFFFFGVFLGLSLFSYSPQDPSLNSLGIDLKVVNYCGYVGAFLADLFLQLFGMSSWIFVIGSFSFAIRFFRRVQFGFPFFANFSLFLIFLFSLSCLLQLYFPKTFFYEESTSLGGALGKILLKGLKPLFHSVGTTILLWAVLVLSLIFYRQVAFFHGIRFLLQQGFKKSPLFFHFFKKILRFTFSNILLFFRKIRLKTPSFKEVKSFIFKRKQKLSPSSPEPVSVSSDSKQKLESSEKKILKVSFEEQKDVKKEFNFKASEQEEEEEFLETSSPPLEVKSFENFPSLDLLTDPPSSPKTMGSGQVEFLSKKLVSKLAQFSIEGRVTAIKPGPAVTLFEFKPNDNVKVSRIREMGNDISLALSSESVRIIAPIPGRDVVGIEVSNSSRQMVYLKTLIKHPRFYQVKIPLVLGRRADNQICVEDLARLPHLLVAGTTGSGKSVFVINFIIGLLYRYTPADMKVLLVDPKQVDLSVFKKVPHLLAPPIVSPQKAVRALRWVCMEMEKRYRSLAEFGVRDLQSFNEVVSKLNPQEKKQHEKNQIENPNTYYYEKLPLFCIVIEEFGDLMMDSQIKKPIETYVVKLAQKARASGIHLILAMQSPRKDVITGLIKTNIPGRISFKVSSQTDSRVILDEGGAERLLSQGDMLFLQPGSSKPLRFHGPYVSEKEVSKVVSFWREEGEPDYEEGLLDEAKNTESSHSFSLSEEQDTMYEEIKSFIRTQKEVSASYLQRRFRIGYPRAARLIEVLYEEGEIGPPQGSKPREVLVHK